MTTLIKCKCMYCRLHFILCTWEPLRHRGAGIHCPECGQTGNKLVWWEETDKPIFTIVPGVDAKMMVST